jgi:hypothetical protein
MIHDSVVASSFDFSVSWFMVHAITYRGLPYEYSSYCLYEYFLLGYVARCRLRAQVSVPGWHHKHVKHGRRSDNRL